MKLLISRRSASELPVAWFRPPAVKRCHWLSRWISGLAIISLVAAAGGVPAAGNGKPAPQAVEQTAIISSCAATVPATGRTGGAVQFQGTFTGGLAGSLAGTDAIAGPMRLVPGTGGTGFTQGTASDPCKAADETPFTHILTNGLAVMETEVTRQMWANLKAVQLSLPSDPTNLDFSTGMNDPVQSCTWYEAILFANLASLQNGLQRCYYADPSFTTPITAENYASGPVYCDWDANGYRLPTEGEWEASCRGGTTGPFSIDEPNYNKYNCTNCNAILPSFTTVAWFCGNAQGKTHPAGTKTANPWNLKDVHGNVWEWCWDTYGTYPAGTVTDYQGAGGSGNRVLRGGGWGSSAKYCRSAVRYPDSPGHRWESAGFRLVRMLDAGGETIWDWNFGDGSAHASTPNPSHSYARGGTFTWTMVVTVNGVPCQQSGIITIYDRPGNFCLGGFLGVGLQAPERALHLRGSNAVFRMDRTADVSAFLMVRTDGAGLIQKGFQAGTEASGVNTGQFIFRDTGTSVADGAGTNRLVIGNDGTATFGETVKAKSFVTTSSARWKENVVPLENAAEMLSLLQGVRYRWKEEAGRSAGGGREDVGLIAEEVARAVPEAVDAFMPVNLPGPSPAGDLKTPAESGDNAVAAPAAIDGQAAAAGTVTVAENHVDSLSGGGVVYGKLLAVALEVLKNQQAQLDGLARQREAIRRRLAELAAGKRTPERRAPARVQPQAGRNVASGRAG